MAPLIAGISQELEGCSRFCNFTLPDNDSHIYSPIKDKNWFLVRRFKKQNGTYMPTSDIQQKCNKNISIFCFQYQLKALLATHNYCTASIFLKCITKLLYIKLHCIHVILWADITDNLQTKQVWQTDRTWIYIREDWHVEYS